MSGLESWRGWVDAGRSSCEPAGCGPNYELWDVWLRLREIETYFEAEGGTYGPDELDKAVEREKC